MAMSKEAVFTVKLDADLRDAFDEWFRDEVERALQKANDPQVRLVPHEEVRSNWRWQRAELLKHAASQPA